MNSRATSPSTAQTTGDRPAFSTVNLARVPNSDTLKMTKLAMRPVKVCSCVVVLLPRRWNLRLFVYFVLGHLGVPPWRFVSASSKAGSFIRAHVSERFSAVCAHIARTFSSSNAHSPALSTNRPIPVAAPLRSRRSRWLGSLDLGRTWHL